MGLSPKGRREAWLLMLGIDIDNTEYQAHRELFEMFVKEKAEDKSHQWSVEQLIHKDVRRTFS